MRPRPVRFEPSIRIPYVETFETGLWPNMDVMPESERRERGRPTAPGSVLWPEERIAAAE